MTKNIISVPARVVFTTRPAKWTLQTRDNEDAGLAIFSWAHGPDVSKQVLNAWTVREIFLKIERLSELTRFLNRTGTFDLMYGRFDNLANWQALLRKLIITKPSNWPSLTDEFGEKMLERVSRFSTLKTTFQWDAKVPAALIWTWATLPAMLATIQIDHLSSAKFRFCERYDCKDLFEVTRRNKIYCDYDCAHLVSVRKSRGIQNKPRN